VLTQQSTLTRLNVPEEYIYAIKRRRQGDTIKVWLSDAYRFTEIDFSNRPRTIAAGDYILIARPEGNGGVSNQLIESAQIGVGKLAEFMGALRSSKMWQYRPPTEEERRTRRDRFGRSTLRRR
jgi:hypothetical protein